MKDLLQVEDLQANLMRVKYVKDQFIIIKFRFFKDIADHLQAFLQGLQTWYC